MPNDFDKIIEAVKYETTKPNEYVVSESTYKTYLEVFSGVIFLTEKEKKINKLLNKKTR